MARRQYIVSYDIADDKRRTALFKYLEGEGDHAQYSVFFCELSPAELAALRGRVRELIDEKEDQVMVVDLGPGHAPLEQGLEVFGLPYQPLTRTLVV